MKNFKLTLIALLLFIPVLVAGCGSPQATNLPAAKPVAAPGELDFSGVVLRIAAAQGANGQSIIEAAGLDKTPYKVEFHVMQGGNLVLEAMAANQIDLGTGSQIPPIF